MSTCKAFAFVVRFCSRMRIRRQILVKFSSVILWRLDPLLRVEFVNSGRY
jgi:hypothetical protein